jgi:hypothetical protein
MMDNNFDGKRRSAILDTHNRLRADPVAFIPFIEKYIRYIKEDNVLYIPNQQSVQLREGVKGFLDAIDFLNKQRPLHTLTFDESLSDAAQEYANMLGEKGLVHNENGLSVSERVEKFCEWETICAESIDYGSQTAEDVIISLLVDDGVNNKAHRELLFNKNIKYIGIGISKHKSYGTVTVIDYVGGIRPKGKSYFEYNNLKYEYPAEFENKSHIRKIKNVIQIKDKDAPDNALSSKLEVSISDTENEGVKRKVTKKIYDLNDGTQRIIEIEDFI